VSDHPDIVFLDFAERPLVDVERAFELLVARGAIVTERAVGGPSELGGPVFRRLRSSCHSVEFVELGLRFFLSEGEAMDDALGGWRIRCEPEELDVRIAGDGSGDVILDATWSPRGSGEIARHSTIVHFMVRALVGDRLPER
jgi:hypothetical protein